MQNQKKKKKRKKFMRSFEENSYKLRGFVRWYWTGQSTEQSRDDFKDARGLEVFSYQNSRRNTVAKHFFEVSSIQLKKYAPIHVQCPILIFVLTLQNSRIGFESVVQIWTSGGQVYTWLKFFKFGLCSQNFCAVNLGIKYWSASYEDLRINFIPLR